MSREKTQEYRLTSKHWNEKGERIEAGTILSLTEAQASFLVNKVELVEAEKPKKGKKPKEEKPEGDEPEGDKPEGGKTPPGGNSKE